MIELLTPTHQEIVNTLRQSNILLAVEHKAVCRNRDIDGMFLTALDPRNHSGGSMIVLCLDTIRANYADWIKELNRTISHESIHAAQACKARNGYLNTIGFNTTIEEEAVELQDNPRRALGIINKYCRKNKEASRNAISLLTTELHQGLIQLHKIVELAWRRYISKIPNK